MSRLIGCAKFLKSTAQATTPTASGAELLMSNGFGYAAG